ncbi:unnamed protein product [Menidia menidia]|uniref:(Atlantic silverside) hypothetical protein n=1 Tax=Menidia menidia TaxID=238744 RepID=A0A8S4BLG7_9TELE|nr:unnamed protein product [Menidia menidia]
MDEARAFYVELYTSQGIQGDCVEEIMAGISNQLSKEDRDFCEGQLGITEAQEAIVQLNKNKSPGSDGLTAEFFQFFTPSLSPMLHRLFETMRKE